MTALTLALTATPASANTVSQTAQHYKSTDFCQKGTSKTLHGGTNNGAWEIVNDNRTRGYLYGVGWLNCLVGYKRPPGWISNKSAYLIWLNNDWQACVIGGWIYNRENVSRLVTGRGYATAPCGAKYYGNMGGTFTWYNSEWKGGWLWSGHHYFPSSSTAQVSAMDESAPPDRPEWVNTDGTVDVSKLPEKIGMVGSDGEPMTDSSGNQVYAESVDLVSPPSGGPGTPDPLQISYVTADEDDVLTEHVIVTD